MQPVNSSVGPLLTDLYELTMARAYFEGGRHEDTAVFDLFFRKNPFGGEYTICAGISEALAFVDNYRFSDDDIAYLEKAMPGSSEHFRKWLAELDCSDVKIHAVREGDVIFPRVPMMRVEGPLGICQLLETTLLNLVGYASLVATNAARMRQAAGEDKTLVEFGLRRAQGPDGGISAARYACLGGFDGTSNVEAARLFDIEASGTQAHAYIQSFSGFDDLKQREIEDARGNRVGFVEKVLAYREELSFHDTNDSELVSFIAYAQAFPDGFLALVDTYDTLRSGIPNAICVALALTELGHTPQGIRLDSGDLAHLSKEARRMFGEARAKTGVDLPRQKIVASNEINEQTIISLDRQGHEIDIFGIGTHLVTCQAQPALGVVYKLVEINGQPRIKLSEDVGKVTIPGRKKAYRLVNDEGCPLVDLMIRDDEKPPVAGKRILCCHPFEKAKRTHVTPARVERLHDLVWDGRLSTDIPDLVASREFSRRQIGQLREDHLRSINPTPYKVSLSERLFDFMHGLWEETAGVGEIS